MKIIAFPLATFVLISGCANLVTPNPTDRTPPTLSLVIYHSGPDIRSPSTGRFTTSGVRILTTECVYVTSPFRVTADANDNGGIRTISIGTTDIPGLNPRELDGD